MAILEFEYLFKRLAGRFGELQETMKWIKVTLSHLTIGEATELEKKLVEYSKRSGNFHQQRNVGNLLMVDGYLVPFHGLRAIALHPDAAPPMPQVEFVQIQRVQSFS